MSLPAFSEIRIDQIHHDVNALIEKNRQGVEKLLAAGNPPDWQHFVEPLEELSDELQQYWSPVSHLHGVKNSDELREAYNACIADLTQFHSEMGQHAGLCQAYQAIKDSPEFASYSAAQQKLITNELRDFHLSGIDLPAEQQTRYREIQSRMAELTTKFSNNVLDATQGWTKHISDQSQLVGLPDTALNVFRQLARAKNLDGWLITLDFPSYLPVMQFSDDRALREEVYTAFTTRASDQGPNAGKWDNSALMEEILQLRYEAARLLGFNSYAERSLATKMATTVEQVLEFLHELAAHSKPMAEQEFQELSEFAGIELQAWDVAYYSEKLREQKYAVSQEELRPYFPVKTVTAGMFEIVRRLYGINFIEQNTFDTYHEDVQLFDITREGEVIAQFYLDLFAREDKRGGAWMADCRVRRRLDDEKIQIPVAFLTCNFTPATDQTPSLLTHQEVTTLFHEFGHGLHHMLTEIEVAGVSGINGVEWDAVELPSQFLENWCWEKEAIPLISSHYESNEPLPEDLLEKLLAAKNFQSGMQMVRQLEFALFDFRLHAEYSSEHPVSIQKILDEVRAEVAVVPISASNRFQHSFSHIFAGGYAAGYYSYKWAEVLSADAFSLFEENGIFDRATGEKFLNEVLRKGGSDSAENLFKKFRGREPKIDALLRHSGIC